MLVAIPLLLLATSAVNAAPYPRRGLDQIISQCNHDFAYTWDDGPYIYHETIKDVFSNADSHTTYFVNGANWGCIYDEDNVQAIRASYEAGHQIAHHTWGHADLATLSYAEIDEQIQRLNEAFVKILGVKPKYLRPPYGSINEDAAEYIQSTYGLTIVMWSDDSKDASGFGSEQWNYEYYTGLADQWDGSPIMSLSHETVEGSVLALEAGTVTALRNKGISLLTVAECLDDSSPYEVVTGVYGTRDSSWTCNGDWQPTPTPSTSTSTAVSTSTSASTSTFISTSTSTSTSIPTSTSTSTPTTASTSTSTTMSTSTSAPPACVTTYNPPTATTCDAIGELFGISGAEIAAANPASYNCADIWAWTPVCIPSISNPTSTSTFTSTSTSTTITTSTSAPPACVTTYSPPTSTTCDSIGELFGISGSEIAAANPASYNCADIWAWTPVCIPYISTSTTSTTLISTTSTSTTSTSTTATSTSCIQTYSAQTGDTCESIGQLFGISADAIFAANSFVDCSNIWEWTPICIPPGPGTMISDPPPTSTSSTTPTPTSTPCESTYTSVQGDTCVSIGQMYGLSSDEILAANPYLSCEDIWAQTPICIPPGGSTPCTATYHSVTGDTCDSIGQLFGVSGAQIQSWNAWVNCGDIWVNTELCVSHS